MIGIAISVAAYDAICATLPLGSVAVEAEPNERGVRTVWLEEVWVDRLGAMRRPGESCSDAILRMVETEPRRDEERRQR
jgi:hypothetical protein